MRAVCPAFNLRRAERLVTEQFNEALAPTGLSVTQIPVLAALRTLDRVPLSRLAEVIVVDLSTLSRSIVVLERRGLVRLDPGPDRRVRIASLTPAGLAKLAEAYPIWQRMQKRVAECFDDGEYAGTLSSLRKVSKLRSPARA